jgi:hypothetical protein
MASGLRIGQWIVVAVAAVAGGLAAGAVGLVVGAKYGGNHCGNCEFNGVRGYEATGQIGLLVGEAIGFVAGGWAVFALLRRRKARDANLESPFG